LTKHSGKGPALTASADIPDRDYFSGRGAKDIIPLYRDIEAAEENIVPGLRDILKDTLEFSITPKDLLAYVYGVAANSTFTDIFSKELETRELRIPITKDRDLFQTTVTIGKRLIWLHTYGERLIPTGKKRGVIPIGVAKCTKALPESNDSYPDKYSYDVEKKVLRVGDGEFGPVSLEIWEFEVSGLRVVKSWLNYRMKAGHGKKSSPLDDIRPERWTSEFTTELLELLWVLEATLTEYPKQKELLEAVVKGPLFRADELPEVPAYTRKAPSQSDTASVFDQEEKEED
jgi:hypothetical protein